jgi:type II secretory pathway component PulF
MVTGQLTAAHRRMALQTLESQGLIPTELEDGGAAAAKTSFLAGRDGMPRIKGAELTEMTRQLATMITSDVTLIDALTVIHDQADRDEADVVGSCATW